MINGVAALLYNVESFQNEGLEACKLIIEEERLFADDSAGVQRKPEPKQPGKLHFKAALKDLPEGGIWM